MLDRTIAPLYTLPEVVELVKAQSIKLSNESFLHIIKAGEQDVVRLEIVYEAGAKYEETKGISYFTSKLLSEGTTKRSAQEIIEYLDLFGAFYELHHGPDNVNFIFYFLKKYTSEVVSVVKEIILEANFPHSEIENTKNITLQGLKVNQNKTSYLASVKFKECLFGENHPYGKILKEEDISKVGREKIISFYQSHIKKSTFNLILSGNIDDVIVKLIADELGTLEQSKSLLPNSVPRSSPEVISSLMVVNKEDSVQSSLRLGNLTISKNHPDYFNWVIVNEILGGYFASRLMKNIREEKGLTYGISSSNVHLKEGSYFVIGTDVKKENTRQVLDEINKEITILKTTLIPQEELDTVKNYLIGTFLSSINTPFSLADKFKSIYFHNMDYSFYSNYLTAIRNSTTTSLIEVANRHLDFDKMTKVVVGGI